MNNFFLKNILLSLTIASSLSLLGSEDNDNQKSIVLFAKGDYYRSNFSSNAPTYQINTELVKQSSEYKYSSDKKENNQSSYSNNKEIKSQLLTLLQLMPEEERQEIERQLEEKGVSKKQFYAFLKQKNSAHHTTTMEPTTTTIIPFQTTQNTDIENSNEEDSVNCFDEICTLF
jgi:hypothetical protein